MADEYKFDFEKDSSIDPNRLHEECFGYGRQAWKYGEALAEATKARDKAHEKVRISGEHLKDVRARLLLKARQDPESCDLGLKPTVDTIDAYCRIHNDQKEANKEFADLQEKLIEANHQVNVLKAGNDSIQFAKSKALDNAVKLYLGEYWSAEGLPKEIPENWKDLQKEKRNEAADKQRQTMKRRK